jgi:hypothetical protein
MSDSYQRPRERKGFVLTAVRWDKAGRVIETRYEPKRRAQAEAKAEPGECSECGRPGPAWRPCRYCNAPGKARGLVAAERRPQPDLFAKP